MTRETRAEAVVFVDVCGSVGLYAERGDVVGHRLVSSLLARAADAATSRGGRVVKCLGDGILAAFPDPGAAFRFALDVVSRDDDPALRSRAAVAFGELISADGDVFGDAVNVAARLLDRAGPQEILVTEAVRLRLTAAERSVLADLGDLSLRGRTEPARTHRLLLGAGAPGGTTPTVVGERGRETPRRLEVVYAGTQTIVDGGCPKLRIGRAADNDLVISEVRVSRYHAEIVLRGTQFLLVDRSVNGCWLQHGEGEAVPVHRTEVVLIGTGLLWFPDTAGVHLRYGC